MLGYTFFDRVIESSFPIPELHPATQSRTAIRVRISSSECPGGSFLQDLELPDGTRWATLRRSGSEFQLEFPDTGTFAISSDGKNVVCYPTTSLPRATLRHLLLNQVLPLAFAQGGETVLHASGVAVDGRACAFLGHAGAGKSTVAASLGRRFPVLSDDALLLKRRGAVFTALGSYADLRLWADSVAQLLPPGATTKVLAHFSDKQRAKRDAAFRFEARPVTLTRIYVLSPGDELGIDPISPADAVIELIRNTYRLDSADYDRLAGDQELFANIVTAGLVRRLRLRHKFSELDAVQKLVLQDARAAAD